jgi:hypothetical protein
MLGLSAAVAGTWVENNGPRKAMFVSACCWAAGFLVSALGIATGQLWLVYLGYGVIGGIGLGIGYIFAVPDPWHRLLRHHDVSTCSGPTRSPSTASC